MQDPYILQFNKFGFLDPVSDRYTVDRSAHRIVDRETAAAFEPPPSPTERRSRTTASGAVGQGRL